MKKAIWKSSGATVILPDARYEKLIASGHIVAEQQEATPRQRKKAKQPEDE